MPRMSWKPESCTSRTKCSGKIQTMKNDENRLCENHPLGEKCRCSMVEPYGTKSSPEDMETQWNPMKRNSLHFKTDWYRLPVSLARRPGAYNRFSSAAPEEAHTERQATKIKIKKKYHELLFNINHCLPVPHTTWDCRMYAVYLYISLAPRVGQRTPQNQHCKGP